MATRDITKLGKDLEKVIEPDNFVYRKVEAKNDEEKLYK